MVDMFFFFSSIISVETNTGAVAGKSINTFLYLSPHITRFV